MVFRQSVKDFKYSQFFFLKIRKEGGDGDGDNDHDDDNSTKVYSTATKLRKFQYEVYKLRSMEE